MRTVLIYRSELLPPSETFIAAQSAALARFHPRFAGLRRVPGGLAIPDDAILLTGRTDFAGKLRARLYASTGIAPLFHQQLAASGADLVHAHFALDGAAALPLARRLKLPLIVTLHGYDVSMADEAHAKSADGRPYLRRREQLWRQASLFLCVSEFTRRQAIAAGFPAAKLRVHQIGVDTRLFAPATAPRDANLVLFIGRMTEKKGLAFLLHAMQSVQREHPAVELAVIGTGPLRHPLEALARSLGVRCRFLGAQPPEEVARWLALAALLCGPSVTAASGDTEGLPIVICEAQAAGLPVVSTLHAGIPEVVAQEETGLLVRERDTQALAAAVSQLLGDHALREEMGAAGARRMRAHFNLSAQTRQLEEIYDAIISQPR